MSEEIIIEEINDQNYNEKTKEGIVVVDCWAPWCGPCRLVAPVIEAMAQERENVRFYKLNTDENPKICTALRIRSIPTFFIYRDGKLVDTIIGAVPKQYFDTKLSAVIENAG